MALLSSPLLLRTHAIILLTLAYYLLTAPSTLLSSPALTLLGESMRLPPAHFQPISATTSGTSPTPLAAAASTELLALLALVLAAAATTQLLFAGSLGVPVTLSFTNTQSTRGGAGGNSEAWKNQLPSLAGNAGAKVSRARRGEDLAVLSAAQNTHMGLAFVRVLVQGVLVAWIYVAYGRRSNTGSGDMGGLGGLERGVGAALGNQVVFTAALGDMLFWGYLWTVVREERREVFKGVERWRAEEDQRDE